MSGILWLDTETYSEVPIKSGTYKYAENCEVDIVSFAIDDGTVKVIDVANGGDLEPFLDAVQKSDTIVAHNAMFDRNVLRLGNLKIDSPIQKWRCSMVRAMAHGLPGGLDILGDIVGLPFDQRKLKEGKDLMRLFCKPLPKNSKLRRATKHTHPEQWAKYLEYAEMDVVAMRAICAKLPSWNYTFDIPEEKRPRDIELRHWHRDQAINDRGFNVDMELVDAALRAVDKEQARLKLETRDVTGYDAEEGVGLGSTSQRDATLLYLLNEHGVMLPDLKMATIERRLNDPDLDEGVKELLRIRLQVSSTSTSKYKALKNGVAINGRLSGTIQFDGASRTRRAAGRTFQPQNLPSRGLLPAEQIELGVQCLMDESEDLIFNNVMLLTTSTIRSCISAPPGKKLVVSDLSNIEGRGLAWLAGEEWKLQAFRDFDEGHGPDLYKLAYAKAFRISPEEVTKFGRSVGKVMELGLGYAGGINAFVTFANVYGIDLEVMANTAWDTLPPEKVKEAEDFLDWLAGKGTTFPMLRRAAITCEVFKRLWREAHPATVRLWHGLEDTFKQAIDSPGKTLRTGKFIVRRDGAWVRIVLPSGRALCYPFARLEGDQIVFKGINQYTRQWSGIKTYSGKLAENCTQSFARDILYDAMPRIEDAGYEIVLHVHDEAVTETPDTDQYSEAELSGLLATPPEYALDMPLAAAGYESYRYKKD